MSHHACAAAGIRSGDLVDAGDRRGLVRSRVLWGVHVCSKSLYRLSLEKFAAFSSPYTRVCNLWTVITLLSILTFRRLAKFELFDSSALRFSAPSPKLENAEELLKSTMSAVFVCAPSETYEAVDYDNVPKQRKRKGVEEVRANVQFECHFQTLSSPWFGSCRG